MQPSTYPPQTLPYLATTDHILPLRMRQLEGSDPVFIKTVREAMKAGGLWIAMQDSEGKIATSDGDVVSYAHVVAVDWLSRAHIRVILDVQEWGTVSNDIHSLSPHRLSAERRPMWKTEPELPAGNMLAIKLTQWEAQFGQQEMQRLDTSLSANNPCWLCFRWLELLPLPLETKQRLLKVPDPNVCVRYLIQVMHCSDLYTG